MGMLEALAEVGAEPDLVVGSSVGSLNGAVLAGCGDVGAAARRLRATWERLRTADVFPRGVLRQARNLTRQRTLYSPQGLRRLIDRALPVRSFETLRIPLAVVAVDARTGHGVTLVEGPLLPALLASTAIPGLLPPVRVGRRTLFGRRPYARWLCRRDRRRGRLHHRAHLTFRDCRVRPVPSAGYA